MDWKIFLDKTRESFGVLQKEIPETFNGFGIMGMEAKKNGALSEKTKEFIALLPSIVLSPPINTLSGISKSLIAVPSAKNSGFESI